MLPNSRARTHTGTFRANEKLRDVKSFVYENINSRKANAFRFIFPGRPGMFKDENLTIRDAGLVSDKNAGLCARSSRPFSLYCGHFLHVKCIENVM